MRDVLHRDTLDSLCLLFVPSQKRPAISANPYFFDMITECGCLRIHMPASDSERRNSLISLSHVEWPVNVVYS